MEVALKGTEEGRLGRLRLGSNHGPDPQSRTHVTHSRFRALRASDSVDVYKCLHSTYHRLVDILSMILCTGYISFIFWPLVNHNHLQHHIP
jgi:hypothetical protein